ncbi:AMP-binding protein [Parasphingopyxis algicola]|uniref:AMP-binding protein n=1 Tax=Parasphingopyxis algicola TaxID=2026624 RepID=UPI0015A1202D|nr:AMP-binding protein [Parasphingopyxis algicola]QLC25172.1 AMP-binding protein [Parasphingopyxis algicola]
MTANIYALFAETARQAGDKALIVERGATRLRYDELDSATARWAAALMSTGARPGDRIVVQVEKSVENVLLYLASLRAGLVYVPLNTAYTAAELDDFIGDAEPAIIVCDPAKESTVAAISDNATQLTLDADGTGSLAALTTEIGADSFKTVAREPDKLAAILYTSGTTGVSKGAMLSHDNLASNALVLKDYWHWQPDDVLIHALPIYHVHGLFVALHLALLGGSTIRFRRSFDADAVLADMPEATVLMGVPTFYVRLADHDGLTREASANMRLFISGSAPLLESTFAEFETKTGHRILERYGMTEAGMITSNPYDGDRVPGTVGFPLPGVSARVADDTGTEMARGEPGVLEIRGPNLFQGYWNKPEKTAEEMRPDGYFITGDIATMDSDGRVAIVGRAKDLIIAGGLNIYPKEIELVLDAVPGVRESAVIGVPHPDLGEAVVAVVVRDDDMLTEEALLSAIADELARFKQPRGVLFADALPRNAMGKVQKAKLRDDHAELFQAR